LYEYKEHFGEVKLNETFHQIDTFEKRLGKWVVLLAVTMKVVPDPPVAKVDSRGFDNFVGQYAWVGSSIVDTVTRNGDKLYIQSSYEDLPTELLPETTDTFFSRGA